MALAELLARIDELQARIIAAGPLSPEAKRKLDYRFRLDWNYHSNVMEGSSLTKLETRTIMLGNVTVDGKPIKDVLEMKGHDDVITKLLQMSSGELQLSEARIKEVHKAIVKEDDPERKEWPGEWKKEPNQILNYRGELYDFPLPDAVAEAMHRLLDRTKADIERIERKAVDAPHPATLAFDFHREYVTIHPFHDGNGRTARIFSNLLLMRFGFPPVVIKIDEKQAYGRFLAEVQVYGAPPDLFNEFMAERLIRSQELVLDALDGKELADPDDLTKRAELLFIQAESEKLTDDERKEQHLRLINSWITSNLDTLVARILKTFEIFTKFFDRHSFKYILNGPGNIAIMPDIHVFDAQKVLQARSVNADQGQIGITLHFDGFKYSGTLKEKKVVVAVRFEPDRILLHWYGPKENDILEYASSVDAQSFPTMGKAANELLELIHKHIVKPTP